LLKNRAKNLSKVKNKTFLMEVKNKTEKQRERERGFA
jgi:hypothetical protein